MKLSYIVLAIMTLIPVQGLYSGGDIPSLPTPDSAADPSARRRFITPPTPERPIRIVIRNVNMHGRELFGDSWELDSLDDEDCNDSDENMILRDENPHRISCTGPVLGLIKKWFQAILRFE